MLSLKETYQFLEDEEFELESDQFNTIDGNELDEAWISGDIYSEEDNDIDPEIDDNMDDINESLIYLNDVNGDYYNYVAEQVIVFNQYRRDALIHEDYEMVTEALGDLKTKISGAFKTVVAKFKEYVPKIVDWIKEKIASPINYLGNKISAFTSFIKKSKDSNVIKDDGNAEDIEQKIEFIEVEGLDKDIMIWKKDVIQSSSFKTLWKTIKGKGSNSVNAIMMNLKNLPKLFDDLKNRILKSINKTENTVLKEDVNNDSSGSDVQKKSSIFGRIFTIIRSVFSRFTTFLGGIFTGIRNFFSRSSLVSPSLSLDFKKAVERAEKNPKRILAVRIMIANDLLVDKSFRLSDKCLAYAEEKIGEDKLYEKFNGEEFRTEKDDWDWDYFNLQMTKIKMNFCKERLDHLKKIIPIVYKARDAIEKKLKKPTLDLDNAFKEKVLDPKTTIESIRIMLKNYLSIDPTGKLFDKGIAFAEKNIGKDKLYDKHESGDTLKTNKKDWNIDYLDTQMVKLVDNFSKERIDLLKRMTYWWYIERYGLDDDRKNWTVKG